LSTLASDTALGVAAGTIDSATGQLIAQQAHLVAAAATIVNTAPANSDLQQVTSTINSAVQSGLVSPNAGAVLTNDITQLASALGINSAGATPPPPPGNGNRNGNGNGGGHGKGK